jgi:hypothetical protein
MESQATSPRTESAAAKGVAGEAGKAPAPQETATERKVESAAKTQPATAVKTEDARHDAPAASAVKPAATDVKPAVVGAKPAVEGAKPSDPVVQTPAASPVPVAAPDANGSISLTWLFVQALMIGALIWGVLVIFGNRGGPAGQSF